MSNVDVFAWLATDMPGIPSSTITHKVNVDHRARLIRQKKWKFPMDRTVTIEEEVSKPLKADYIMEV